MRFMYILSLRCALQTDYGNVVSRVTLEGFKNDEILRIVRGNRALLAYVVACSNPHRFHSCFCSIQKSRKEICRNIEYRREPYTAGDFDLLPAIQVTVPS